MKYINSYKIFEDKEYEQSIIFLESIINKELIEDLKELSIDLIDAGYTLIINFYTPQDTALGSTEINHVSSGIWAKPSVAKLLKEKNRNYKTARYGSPSNPMELEIGGRIRPIKYNQKVVYEFYFFTYSSTVYTRNFDSGYIFNDDCVKISKAISGMYPNEKIVIKNQELKNKRGI